ncbi:MAG: elongation factor G [Phycisphaerales bacterium]
MAVRIPANFRNICLVGNSGCGKTTLTERLLFATGVTQRMGSVEEGNTASDWSDDEKHHKHSLRPSTLFFEHEHHGVNLIDTPGLADFIGHAIACFPAVETVAVCIDAHRGIESTTRRLMAVAAERNLPRVIIVNKIDDANADCEGLVEQIREVFGSECLPINLPAKKAESVVDVFEHEHSEGGEPDFSSVEDAHQQIIEQAIEVDEELMAEYLEKGAAGLSPKQTMKAFRRALCESHLIPVCFVSARSGAGVPQLLHIFATLLPSPLDGNPRTFIKTVGEGDEAEFHPGNEPDAPVLAHVFKIESDPFVGKIGVFRVHQGTLHTKSEVYIDDLKKSVRIGHLLKRRGKEQMEVHEIGPGDIGAVAKIDEIHFGATMHATAGETYKIKPLPLPRPMFGLAVELKNHKDEAKFAPAVHKLEAEDPCFKLERVAATKQTVLRGLGELHLRIVLERLKNNFGIEVETAPPKIAYKETIGGKAEGHHRHKKQSGGSGEFGEVYLRVEPLPSDHEEGFEFVNATVGGSIPKQFMPAIEKGIRQVLGEGAVAGYPMGGIRVEVYDGKYHAVDSKEIAFLKAGRRAFIEAIKKARPLLLEPHVMLEVTAPSQYMGDLTGDLSTKRARVQDTEMIGSDVCLIRATAPLGELQNYSNQLKSITGGSGAFTMDYDHDEQTPAHVQQEVIAAFEGHKDED